MERRPGQYRPESEKPKSTDPPKPQSESALGRAVERTRALYERNGWVFLPLSEEGKVSPNLSSPQTERSSYSSPNYLNYTPGFPDNLVDELNREEA